LLRIFQPRHFHFSLACFLMDYPYATAHRFDDGNDGGGDMLGLELDWLELLDSIDLGSHDLSTDAHKLLATDTCVSSFVLLPIDQAR